MIIVFTSVVGCFGINLRSWHPSLDVENLPWLMASCSFTRKSSFFWNIGHGDEPYSAVFGNGYEVQKKRKSAVLTSAASTEEITVTLKSSNQKDVFCSKCLQTVQQRSKFPSPKNLLSLKYPKRGMSLWLQFQETRYQWTLLLSIQRWWCPLAVLEENQKFYWVGGPSHWCLILGGVRVHFMSLCSMLCFLVAFPIV